MWSLEEALLFVRHVYCVCEGSDLMICPCMSGSYDVVGTLTCMCIVGRGYTDIRVSPTCFIIKIPTGNLCVAGSSLALYFLYFAVITVHYLIGLLCFCMP